MNVRRFFGLIELSVRTFAVNLQQKIVYGNLCCEYAKKPAMYLNTAGSLMGGTPATSRHTSHTLRLLPSGPDRVHELLLREDQSPIILCRGLASNDGAIIQYQTS